MARGRARAYLNQMDAARLTPPRRLEIPVPEREAGGVVAALEIGPTDRPVDLLFLHANGFNAGTYRQLLAPLGGALRVLALDLRGHGRTRLSAEPAGRRNWADFTADIAAVLDRLDGPPVVVAGHSMGGTAGLLGAAERPGRVSSLVLLDPVIWPRPATLMLNLPLSRRLAARIPLVKGALRRRRTFKDRQEALAAYRGRGAFKGWPDAVLADYVAEGFVEEGDHVRLTCAPEWEASNYAAQAHDPWRALARLDRPVRILRAARDSTCHVMRPTRPGVTVETVDAGHFFPMTRADVARDALFDAAV